MTQAVNFDEENGNDRKAYTKHGATVTPAVVLQSTDTVTISPPQILDRLTQHTKVPKSLLSFASRHRGSQLRPAETAT